VGSYLNRVSGRIRKIVVEDAPRLSEFGYTLKLVLQNSYYTLGIMRCDWCDELLAIVDLADLLSGEDDHVTQK